MESSSPPNAGAVLAKHFETLHDPRVARGRLHPLLNVVVIALLGVICGAEGWDELEVFGESKATWLATFLDLTNGTPSADTIRRVFEALKPSEFSTCMQSLVQPFQRGQAERAHWTRRVLPNRHRERSCFVAVCA